MANGAPEHVEIQVIDVGPERLAILTFPAPVAPHHDLTPVEADLLARLAMGMTNAEIAAARRRSVHTVANQIAALSRRFAASSRIDLVARTSAMRAASK